MKRDMDLVRKILLQIEEEYVSTSLFDLAISGYDKETIAYHCKIMHEAGMVSGYSPFYADDRLFSFKVSGLTWEGNDYLDKVRDDSMWGKTKDIIKKQGLPLVIETIKSVTSALITAATQGITNSIMQNGGVGVN